MTTQLSNIIVLRNVFLNYSICTDHQLSSVQLFGRVQLCNSMDCSTPGLLVHTNSRSLLKFMSIELVIPSNHLILRRPLLLHLQSFPASGSFPVSQFFASDGQSIGVFIFNISPSNEHPGLISFRMDWFDLLAVQGTLESSLTPQFESISSLVLSLYGPAFTCVLDYWKNHSFAYMELCWQDNVSAF